MPPRQRPVDRPQALATLQWVSGILLLAIVGWFYLLDRTTAFRHFIGPRFFVLLLTPFGAGLIGSGLALRYRWPGWQLLQLVPWLAAAFALSWMRRPPM
jgi:hypothetical protein